MEGVDRAVCLFLEENKIAAFYEGAAVKRDIAVGLEHLLPRYMFPCFIQKPDGTSTYQNGKVDRQALRRLYG